MIRNEDRYSLVAAYETIHGERWYYRLADYDTYTKKLVEAEYITDQIDEYEPVNLYSKENKELYKTVIKKWQYDINDIKKQYIKENDRFKGKVYEISFLEKDIENKEFDESYIRKVLNAGFYVDYEVNNEFLLIVGNKNNKYVVLECQKNKFKQKTKKDANGEYIYYYIEKNDNDLAHALTFLNMYYIPHDSIIFTTNLLDHPYTKNVIEIERYFYEELKLPTTQSKFLVRDSNEYTIGFFSKYFKNKKDIFELTNKERSKFISIIGDIRNNEKELEEYFSQTGYDKETAKVAVENIIEKVIENLKNDSEFESILLYSLLNDKDVYSDCMDQVKKDWESSQDYQVRKKQIDYELSEYIYNANNKKDEILKELELYNEELIHMQNQKDSIIKEIANLNLQKQNVENIVLEGQEKEKNINESISKKLKDFKEDVVTIVTEMGLIDSLNKQKDSSTISVSNKDYEGYIHTRARDVYENKYHDKVEIFDYDDFVDYFIDNLTIHFEKEKQTIIVASFIATLINHKKIITSEYTGEILADSLSKIIDGTTTEKYYITNTDIDVKRLFNSISNTDNTVIYIDGLLNTYNEILVKTIVKLFRKKIIIFGCDDNIIDSLSPSIWNYATYIALEDSIIDRTNDKYLVAKCNVYELLSSIKGTFDLKLLQKDVKTLKKNKLITNNQQNSLEYMISAYNSVVSLNNLPVFFLNHIYLSSSNRELFIEKIVEIIPDIAKYEDSLFFDLLD